jgi:hypothetical protein
MVKRPMNSSTNDFRGRAQVGALFANAAPVSTRQPAARLSRRIDLAGMMNWFEFVKVLFVNWFTF